MRVIFVVDVDTENESQALTRAREAIEGFPDEGTIIVSEEIEEGGKSWQTKKQSNQ